MTVGQTLRAAPGLTRILRILARHGFIRALRGRAHWPDPTQVRSALEELGVVYIKFGQVMALRRDLLPPPYVAELEQLHDRLPAEDFPLVRSVVERELGQTLALLFASFDEVPLAAASIAQVHAATLHDGRHVVVKVRRPGLAESIATDIGSLTYLAALTEQFRPGLRGLDLVGMVREFQGSLNREMNLELEGRTIRRFRKSLAGDENLWIPDVVPERTSPGVLTVEHSPGERIDNYGEAHPEARSRLARGVAALVLRQVFETGLFNADPHPGNLFVLPDGRLCLHDFGMIGELNEPLREGLVRLLESVAAGDSRQMSEAYLELGAVGEDTDRAALEADLGALLRRIRERPLAEISVGEALSSMLRVGSQHRLRNPGEVLLLARAFLIAEAVMRRLEPGLNVIELFGAEVKRVELLRYSPERLAHDARELSRDMQRLLRGGPTDARRALRRLGDGELGRIHVPGVEALVRRCAQDMERMTGAMVSAALIVAGALLVTAGGWHRTAGDVLLVIGLGTALLAAGGAIASYKRKP